MLHIIKKGAYLYSKKLFTVFYSNLLFFYFFFIIKKIFQIFISGKCLSKYQKNKANILNYIFYHFEFVVCFATVSHEVERDIILDLSSTAASMKSKLESGDTSTRRVWLCEDPHSSVVGAVYVHVLRTLSSIFK